MRVLLVSNASYAPPKGGSTRSNLIWLEALARAGHVCCVVCSPGADEGPEREEVQHAGLVIVRIRQLARHASLLGAEIEAFRPDWVLVSSEDLSHLLIREAQRSAPGRLVYLAHTPQWFPFGPESWNPDAEAASIVRHARAVVAIGHHMAGYIAQHLGREARVIHPPMYGPGPWPDFAKPDGAILLINPCAVKGIRIFLALADWFPHLRFEALAGWGTTSADREEMARRPNVSVLETVPSIDDALARACILLMPSLWYEGFGLIVTEAMLRGLPVIASDSGGLKEAKQGTGYVIPVRPITRYQSRVDETGMPQPLEVAQDLDPWIDALRSLTERPDAYRGESQRSREAARAFVASLRARDLEDMLRSLEEGAPLRILLAHNSTYYPPKGGGDLSNRLLMEDLASQGHSVRVVSRTEDFGAEAHQRFLEDLARRGVVPEATEGPAVRMRLNGVDVRTISLEPRLRACFEEQIREFDPDVIVTSTDDPAQLLLEPALRAPRARVVHLVRATIAVPFGPDASSRSQERTTRLQRADAIVAVSEYVAKYCRTEGGLAASHVPISPMPFGTPPLLGTFNNPYVVMTNPCAVKGIAVFLELARAFPRVNFAAIPSWGTTRHDLAALESLPNVRLIGPYDDIDEMFRQVKVLLVPSLWAEARSRIVVEALARGVPVLAADSGGIPEAMCGVDYVLPVNPLRGYRHSLDENLVPVADVPPQEIGPWRTALHRLVSDAGHYGELSAKSREAALAYLRDSSPRRFEGLLQEIVKQPKKSVRPSDSLSPEKKRLLALRLKQRATAISPWFPRIPAAPVRLFAFPHAGAGALFWRNWPDSLALCPALLPGREARLHEPALDAMDDLVTALADAVEPFLDRPFAFFGHSMGAGVAFELTRELRRRGLPLPKALAVSAARAPRFRREAPPRPEPDDEQLIEESKRWGAVPSDPVLLRLSLPALRADTRLYRNWRPAAGAPLPLPLYVYGGEDDPNIGPHHLEEWREETSSAFNLRLFPGSHLYLAARPESLLLALRDDLGLG
jgi:surfactin synthase thioesterase subunit/glycosyltransferase involved in cell wall biosynthesis